MSITTCRGRGRIVAAELQAVQLVYEYNNAAELPLLCVLKSFFTSTTTVMFLPLRACLSFSTINNSISSCRRIFMKFLEMEIWWWSDHNANMEFLKEFLQLRDRANCKSFVEKLSWGTYVLSKCFLILMWDVLRRSTCYSHGSLNNKLCGSRHNMPRPVTLTFDLESGVRVTCDVGYRCANFSLPRLIHSRLGPMYVTDRRQTRIIA